VGVIPSLRKDRSNDVSFDPPFVLDLLGRVELVGARDDGGSLESIGGERIGGNREMKVEGAMDDNDVVFVVDSSQKEQCWSIILALGMTFVSSHPQKAERSMILLFGSAVMVSLHSSGPRPKRIVSSTSLHVQSVSGMIRCGNIMTGSSTFEV
jgi:hypothetical protein